MLLDVLVIILIAIFVVIGFSKGIAKTAVSVVGTLAVSALSMFLSKPLSEYIYRTVIKVSFTEKIKEAIITAKQTGYSNVIDKIVDTLPKYIDNSLFDFGITQKELAGAASKGAEAIETLLAPAIISFISLLTAFILFVLLMVVVKLISRVIYSAIDSSVLGVADRFLGALVGLAEGFIIVFIAMFILRVAIPHMESVPDLISDQSISDTVVFKGIYDSQILTGIVSSCSVSPNIEASE